MSKIIWKDIDSSTIKGLLICELPPITKPKMRVQETTVDGVDGSIIEELGYQSYNKSIKIGLTRDYDIDEIIKYFTGEGNVVFSNELNKYYKARIIEQIDYERLLRFKEAVVKFRVQPFKYEYQEEEQSTETGSVEGTEVKVTDAKATEIKIDGRSTQDGTPTPDAPVEIKSVGTLNNETGKSEIEVKTIGKNLFNKENVSVGYYINYNTGSISKAEDGLTASDFIEVKPNTQYYCNFVAFASSNFGMAFYDENKTFISGSRTYNSITTPDNAKYLRFCVRNEEYSSGTSITDINTVQLEEGSVATEYQPYQERITVIELNAPLRSLPNGVKDIAYIRNNKLYVDRYVGSVVLDGSEEWLLDGNIDNLYRYKIKNSFLVATIENSGMSNYFQYEANYQGTEPHFYLNTNGSHFFFTNISTLEEFKTWLSTHNVQVDYELATPVTEELGDLTIIQLVDGENNISNSENANMVIDYTEILKIDNKGNYISKPIFEIEGAGNIVLKINDNSIFSYNFDEDGQVVIDSEKEDAYLGVVLKNRNMNGEFPKLEIGENKITWDGLVKNIKASKKSRWL